MNKSAAIIESSQKKLNVFLKEDNFLKALKCCDELINAGSDDVHLLSVKGWCLHKTGQAEQAREIILTAFDKAPSKTQVSTITLSFLMEITDYEKVVEICQRCSAYNSNDYLTWHRLGTAHFFMGEMRSSILAFRRALTIKNSDMPAFGLSMSLLNMGEYEEGLALYEKRFAPYPKLDWLQSEKLPMPKWQGEPIENKSLLVWSEQGLGDSIQFSRLANVLAKQGVHVDVFLQSSHGSLAGVLSTVEGIDDVTVIEGNTVNIPRRYDFHCSMMSLLVAMNIRINTIPNEVPYISVPDTDYNANKALASISDKKANQLKVGIVWSSKLTHSLLNSNPMQYFEKDKKSIDTTLG